MKYDDKKYITHYDVVNDKILIYYAYPNNEKQEIAYTLESELLILSTMRDQIEYWLCDNEHRLKSDFWDDIRQIYLGIFGVMYPISCLKQELLPVLPEILIGFFSVVIALGLEDILYLKNKWNTLKKYKLFLQNEEKFNQHYSFSEEDLDLYLNLPQKSQEEQIPAININTIYNMEYQDVKRLVKEINQAEKLNVEYYVDSEEMNVKILSKEKRFS